MMRHTLLPRNLRARSAMLPGGPALGSRTALSWRRLVSWFFCAILFTMFLAMTPTPYFSAIRATRGPTTLQAAADIDQGRPAHQVLIAVLGLVAVAGILAPSRRNLAAANPAAWAGLAFVLTAAASPAWSDDPVLTLRRVFVLLTMCTLAVSIVRVWDAREVLAGIIAATLTASALSWGLELFSDASGILGPDFRFGGIWHPNRTAEVCGILLVSALVGTMVWPVWRRSLRAIAGFALVSLLLTKSRGGIAAAMFAVALLITIRLRRAYVILAALSLATAGLVLALFFFSDQIKDALTQLVMMGRIDQDAADMAALTGRVPIWAQLWWFVERSPVLGYGYNSFWTLRRTLEIAAVQGWNVGHSHSGYLDLLLSLGVVGLVPWLAALAATPLLLVGRYKSTHDAAILAGAAIMPLIYVNMIIEVVLMQETIPSLIGLIFIASALYLRPAVVPTGYPPAVHGLSPPVPTMVRLNRP